MSKENLTWEEVAEDFMTSTMLTNLQLGLLSTGRCVYIFDVVSDHWRSTVYVTSNDIMYFRRPASAESAKYLSKHNADSCFTEKQLDLEELTKQLQGSRLWSSPQKLAAALHELSANNNKPVPAVDDYPPADVQTRPAA